MTEVTLPAPVGVVDCPPGFWAMASEKLVAENERPPSWLRLKGAEAGTIDSSHRQQPCASHPDWGVGMREVGLEQSSA